MQMRIRGIAKGTVSAGIPVSFADVQEWMCGRTNPPRGLEGINDPISVTTVAYFGSLSLSRNDRMLGENEPLEAAFFDYAHEAHQWAYQDVEYYVGIYRSIRDEVVRFNGPSSLSAVAEACEQLLKIAQSEVDSWANAASLSFSYTAVPVAWLVALHVPELLYRSGMTTNVHPNLVPTLRSTGYNRKEIEDKICSLLAEEQSVGSSMLDDVERRLKLIEERGRTIRSKSLKAAEYMTALPRLRSTLLAKALGTTPQGAGYL